MPVAGLLATILGMLLAGCSSSKKALPEVVGPAPSERVAAFYYPWYGNPDTDGEWVHWGEDEFNPPGDISSDLYPQLGTYSSADPEAVAQHMAWLRQAGVGVIISSWWGQGSREDRMVPLLMSMAERYGIKVAFHIEPYQDRTPEKVVADVTYLSAQYGPSPAFFRRSDVTEHSPGAHAKEVYFVWSVGEVDKNPFSPAQWTAALDQIHDRPGGALSSVIQ